MPLTRRKLPHRHFVKFERNTQGRDLAVGDIHGCFDELQRALDAIGFRPEVDRLFPVGDLVDRGPQSHEVLSWLDKPWLHSGCGNHDFMTWRAASRYPYREVDHKKHGGDWLYSESEARQEQIAERLMELPLVMEVDTENGPVGIVHADFPFNDWNRQHEKPLSEKDIDCCLWSIMRFQLNYQRPIDNIRAVIHGHMTIPEPKVLGNCYFIDTGGWKPREGYFTFVDLNTLEILNGPGPKRYNATGTIRDR